MSSSLNDKLYNNQILNEDLKWDIIIIPRFILTFILIYFVYLLLLFLGGCYYHCVTTNNVFLLSMSSV